MNFRSKNKNKTKSRHKLNTYITLLLLFYGRHNVIYREKTIRLPLARV